MERSTGITTPSAMTTLDDLWYLATQAEQQAEQAYHRLREAYSEFLEPTHRRTVSRPRFRTLTQRIVETGTPFGAHTIVYRPSGELLLVRHQGVDRWVLPGGGVRSGETFRETAERELTEEAGIEADYDGLAMATRVELACGEHTTWGVMPTFQARAKTTDPTINDPDDEIVAADWFAELPADTRDRDELLAWRERTLSV